MVATSAGDDRALAATPSRGVVLLTVLLCQSLLTLDTATVIVAAPAIRADLDAAESTMTLIIAAYSLAFAVSLVLGGRLGDMYGRRRLLLASMAGFVLADALSALAPSPGLLVLARLVAGTSAALIAPQVLAVIQVTFPPAERPRALGLFGTMSAVAMVFGQVGAGGLLRVDVFAVGWRAPFAISAALALALLAVAARVVPESRAGGAKALDPLGVALLALGMGLVVFPLVMGRSNGWESWVWACLALAGPVLGAFIAHEARYRARTGAPLVDLSLFRIRSFAAGLTTQFSFSLTTGPFLFLFTLVVQLGLGYDALGAAVLFLLMAVPFFFGSRLSGRMVVRLGRPALVAAASVSSLGCVVLGVTALVAGADLGVVALASGLVVIGLGHGMMVPMMLMFTLSEVPRDHVGAAAGMYATFQQLAGSIGVSVMSVVYFEALRRPGGVGDHADAFGVTMLAYMLVATVVGLGVVRLLPRWPDLSR